MKYLLLLTLLISCAGISTKDRSDIEKEISVLETEINSLDELILTKVVTVDEYEFSEKKAEMKPLIEKELMIIEAKTKEKQRLLSRYNSLKSRL